MVLQIFFKEIGNFSVTFYLNYLKINLKYRKNYTYGRSVGYNLSKMDNMFNLYKRKH